MKKKIFFWAPFLNNVGTVKSTINSALSLRKYCKNYEVYIINTCGEWNSHKKLCVENFLRILLLKLCSLNERQTGAFSFDLFDG